MTPCANCGRPFDEPRFPCGRPRKDGRQYPGRYCDACLGMANRHRGVRLRAGGHEALLAAKAAYRARRRVS